MDYDFEMQATEEDTQGTRYSFVVDENGPRKLGDGSYGAVFEARDPGEQKCAVKLFYPSKDAPESEERNRHEMKAGLEVRRKLAEKSLGGLAANLVLSSGWSDSFCSSKAADSLKDEFKKLGVAISNQALVMPYYECTLKDVLETGAPAGRLVDGTICKEKGTPGYEILRGLSVAERERNIIGIVSCIVTGLRALHVADLFHHDVKPANVMLRVAGNDVEVALGDFGFLEYSPVTASATGYRMGLPFGTRHYRSPEQKDFFDLCDVRVTCGSQSGEVILETADRKFGDTLIDKGDIAVFSKDDQGAGYTVEQVEHRDEKSRIVLDSPRQEIFEDERTQVVFYKNPSPRTDVFGIGALLFDLLTAGRSPEGFYDHLRRFDRPGGDVPTVNSIVEQYRAAAGANSTSAELASIFEQVRDGVHKRFPSAEIVAVLLRCMLSRRPDSYYAAAGRQPDGKVDRHKLFSTIQEDLRRIAVNTPMNMPTSNPIWVGRSSVDVEESKEGDDFRADLSAVQGMPQGKRCLWGALRLRQLRTMIQWICQQDTFFTNLSPGNLRFRKDDTEIGALVEGYKSETDYLHAVRSGTAWTMEATGDTDNYVPIYRRFDVRGVEVEMEEGWTQKKELVAKVRYAESLPVWRASREGDLVRITDSIGRVRLYEIIGIPDTGISSGATLTEVALPKDADDPLSAEEDAQEPVEPEERSSDPETSDAGEEAALDKPEKMVRARGHLVRRLVPLRYYLSVMAVYVHHFFFADGGKDNGTVPDVVWSFFQKRLAGEGDLTRKKATGAFGGLFGPAPETGVARVRLVAARVYLELMLMAERRVPCDREKDFETEMMTRLLQLVQDIDEAVAELCGFSSVAALHALGTRQIGEMESKLPIKDDDKTFATHLKSHMTT